MSSSLRTALAALATVAFLAVPVGPAQAAHDDDHGAPVPATWETHVDGGQRTDEVALFAAASPTTNNSVESLFVTGVARKSPALEALGVDDFDVLTTAFDAGTGAVRWNVRHDDALGSHDRPVGMEVNYNNNLLYVVADAAGDAVTLTYSVRDGELVDTYRRAGMSVNDTAISVAGSWLFEAGNDGGDFQVLGYETGPDMLSIDDAPVAGEAVAADAHNDYDSGNIDSWRTVVVTGRETVFGSGGDAYTAAYRIDTKAKVWERRYASPANRLDEGVAVDMTYVRSLGHGVAYVTGKTFDPATGFDLWVAAYDARTGAPLWSGADGMRRFGGPELGDDVPVAIEYNDTTGIVYVTGTSRRGAPHGRDVVTIAYDGLTGEQLGVAYASGDISNGNDSPTDLTVSDDGSRVFVAAEVHNLQSTGGYRAGVFGYDSELDPAGSGFLAAGGAGVDNSVGVAVTLDGAGVLLGGGSDTGPTRLDHGAARFPVSGFEPIVPDPVATDLAFTDDSAGSGVYDEEVEVAARLTDPAGAPIAGETVVFSVDGDDAAATTGADGVARRTVRLGDPGTSTVVASFAGTDAYLPSSASTTIDIAQRSTVLTLAIGGQGVNKTLTATLADDRSRPLAGRAIRFFADGAEIGTATTDAEGHAHLDAPPGARGRTAEHRAEFDGDTRYGPSYS